MSVAGKAGDLLLLWGQLIAVRCAALADVWADSTIELCDARVIAVDPA